MRKEIMEEIAKSISDSYSYVLLTGFEEEKHKFTITMCIIDFIEKLREKNIVYNLDYVFNSDFLDKIYVEANNYIGK